MNHSMNRKAFSLLEMMVVIGIAALMAALSFGVINNTSRGNRNAQCASNLTQIYGALRLYAQDYDGLFPYANPAGLASQPTSQQGLWLLLKYPNGTNAGYLKSSGAFSCPLDQTSTKAPFVNSMSYQWDDDRSPAPSATYSLFREDGEARQLRYFEGADTPQKRSVDTTVVTWCRWHRPHNKTTGETTNNDAKDNILFLDGRVQTVPVLQPVVGASNVCAGWERLPLENANQSQAADFCTVLP